MVRRIVVVGCAFLAVNMLLAADSNTKPAAADAGATDLTRMQGKWSSASVVRNGERLPDEAAQALFRIVKDDQFTIYRYNKPVSKGTLKIDATKRPRTIDVTSANLPAGVKAVYGIYEFDGERLKVCMAPAGRSRPTRFEAPADSDLTLTVWERVKDAPAQK